MTEERIAKKPIVSILMATWNRARLIGEAIESVRRQTFVDWELLVIDDGSPDNTAEVMAEWEKKDARIKYLKFPRIGNIAGVSNAGLREARGEFVAILDDDDYWIDDRKLEKQVAFLREHPNYITCGGCFVTVDAHGRETGRLRKPETDAAIRRVMLSANAVANSTSLFRREPAGLYDETLPQFADWDFFLRLGTRGKLYNFPDYFLGYRMWDDSSSFRNQRKNADAALVIIDRYRNNYPGYPKAFVLTRAYWLYARLPGFIRNGLNASLSRLKKAMFSR
jgi:glycosyltransferase involved in cell wall biosynthesis